MAAHRERTTTLDRAGAHARQGRRLANPSASTEIWISLIFFIVLYGLLAAVDGTLMFRFGRKALSEGDEDEHGAPTDDETSSDDEPVPALTY